MSRYSFKMPDVVRIETQPIGDPLFPRIITFSQDFPISAEEMKLKAYQLGEGKKRKISLRGDLNGAKFEATDHGESSWKKNSCKYAVGVLENGSQIMKLYPSDHIYVMRFCNTTETTNQDAQLNFTERRKSLTDAFGSRKKKKALVAAQSNVISAENIANASAVEQNIFDVNEANFQESGIDAAHIALELNRSKLLPKFDKRASRPEDIYSIDSILPSKLSNSVYESFEEMSGDLSKERIDLQSLTFLFERLEASELPKYILKNFLEKNKTSSSLLFTSTNKIFVCRLIFLCYMVQLYTIVNTDSCVSKAVLMSSMHQIRGDVFHQLEENFLIFKRKEEGQPSFFATKEYK